MLGDRGGWVGGWLTYRMRVLTLAGWMSYSSFTAAWWGGWVGGWVGVYERRV